MSTVRQPKAETVNQESSTARKLTGARAIQASLLENARAIAILRREREEELRRNAMLMEEAQRQQREFIANLSHEIRTPLSGILGMANIITDTGLTPEQQSYIDVICECGELLQTLLNDILDMSKIESGRLETEAVDFNLAALLDSVMEIWRPKSESSAISFVLDAAALRQPALRSDPTRIRQILFNLLSNALKFTASGEIRVAVFQAAAPDGRIVTRFEVRDTGEGVDPEKLPRLFQKFQQADSSVTRRHGGTGLGLAICKALTEALGGEIGAESEPGRGSTFWFTVVCEPGNPAEIVDLTAPPQLRRASRRLRILAAEDNAANQKVIRLMLKRAGHQVEIAANGAEAVAAVLRGGFDVVLMDIQMPEMDGVTATRQIREIAGETGRIPIIALTANAMKGDRDTYLSAGMNEYVAKPIDPALLTAALRRVCGSDVAATTALRPEEAAGPAAAASHVFEDFTDLLADMEALEKSLSNPPAPAGADRDMNAPKPPD